MYPCSSVKKGDLQENENHPKNNCLITKLVYVYEGIEKESPRSKRNRLINPHYFCGVNTGEGNQRFWKEVYEYLDSHYDLEMVKKIYLNSDGMEQIPGVLHVLDEFHLEKYLMKLTGHMKDSQADATEELRRTIHRGSQENFIELAECLKEYLPSSTGIVRMEEAKHYVLSNWTAVRIRLKHKEGVRGSSTEGYVSHILSSRMSSRPMGWSIKGAAKMPRLRAYHLNHGNMLELVRWSEKGAVKGNRSRRKKFSNVKPNPYQ